MIRSSPGFVGAVVITLALLPGRSAGQTIARSFDDLQKIVKVGETVLVTDQSGREVAAKIADVSAAALVILTRETTRDAGGMERRTFSEKDVQRIRRSGGNAVKKGTLIGAGVAFGLTLAVAAAWGQNEGGGFCGGCLAVGLLGPVPFGAGIGAGVGFGIRQARRKTIYIEPGVTPPLIARSQRRP